MSTYNHFVHTLQWQTFPSYWYVPSEKHGGAGVVVVEVLVVVRVVIVVVVVVVVGGWTINVINDW